jgi:hypothetical protein
VSTFLAEKAFFLPATFVDISIWITLRFIGATGLSTIVEINIRVYFTVG